MKSEVFLHLIKKCVGPALCISVSSKLWLLKTLIGHVGRSKLTS